MMSCYHWRLLPTWPGSRACPGAHRLRPSGPPRLVRRTRHRTTPSPTRPVRVVPRRLWSTVRAWNAPSSRVPEKLGFERDHVSTQDVRGEMGVDDARITVTARRPCVNHLAPRPLR